MKQNKRIFDLVAYIAIIILALLFLYVGNKVASKGIAIEYQEGEFATAEAKVTKILDIYEDEADWFSSTTVIFEARITKGADKDEIITAFQTLGSYSSLDKEVSEGDKILVNSYDGSWSFSGYVRVNKIVILGGIFIVLLLLFGRIKGLNAILTLGFTCIAVFAVFIPAILSGKNIYMSSIVVCIYTIIVTLFLLNGINKKSLAAVAGCFGGVIAAGLLTFFMSSALGLTGLINDETMYLVNLPTENPIDLKAIVFAGIIIGAVGAIMDVAVSISSALWELKEQAQNLTFNELFKSGLNIGKDIMGSMANTLVLAYIGSSLSMILLLVVYAVSFIDLFNLELVIVELLQAIIGATGILLTMPLTALICAALYSKKTKPVKEPLNEE